MPKVFNGAGESDGDGGDKNNSTNESIEGRQLWESRCNPSLGWITFLSEAAVVEPQVTFIWERSAKRSNVATRVCNAGKTAYALVLGAVY